MMIRVAINIQNKEFVGTFITVGKRGVMID